MNGFLQAFSVFAQMWNPMLVKVLSLGSILDGDDPLLVGVSEIAFIVASFWDLGVLGHISRMLGWRGCELTFMHSVGLQ